MQENIWIQPVFFYFYVVFLKSQNISGSYLQGKKNFFLFLKNMPFPVQLINVRKTDKCFITCYRTWRITWLIKAFDQESHRCFRPRARQYLKPPLTIKDLKTGSKNIFVINFENKGFDRIHVSSLFCCQDVIFQLPEHRKQMGIFLFILWS